MFNGFGAFVYSVHRTGLLHSPAYQIKSLLSIRFEVVSVGDIVEVKVLSVDVDRKRIQLSMV